LLILEKNSELKHVQQFRNFSQLITQLMPPLSQAA